MLHAVIMAGGSGTRFWPASRKDRPKQFLAMAADEPLLRTAFDRLTPLVPAERIWVVTAEDTAALTRNLLPELPPGNVLGEPEGRDTAACVGLAAHVVLRCDPEAVCVVLPADHCIGDEENFRAGLAAGVEQVERAGGLLTFGLKPTAPETGFGYLRVGSREREVGDFTVHRLDTFVEKPDEKTAAAYLEDGGYLWNSGMFAWRAADLLAEIERQLPLLGQGLRRLATGLGAQEERALIAEVYPKLPRISVDFGVMEGAETCWTIPVDYPWSDVGSWPALRTVGEADGNGVVSRGRVVSLDCADSVIVSEGPVIAAIGLDGMVVVATDDGLLVMPADRAQDVKRVVAEIEGRGWSDVL